MIEWGEVDRPTSSESVVTLRRMPNLDTREYIFFLSCSTHKNWLALPRRSLRRPKKEDAKRSDGQANISCILNKQHAHTHARAHAQTHTHTLTRTRTRTCTRTAHAHDRDHEQRSRAA